MIRSHGKPFPYQRMRRAFLTGGVMPKPDSIAIAIKVDEARLLKALRTMNRALRVAGPTGTAVPS